VDRARIEHPLDETLPDGNVVDVDHLDAIRRACEETRVMEKALVC
jgi:hypothetical protein